MDYDVFISYSRQDRELVDALTKLLRLNGRRVFRDAEDIKPGERWSLQLTSSLSRSKQMVLFWCCHADKSEWVGREIEQALTEEKALVPILLCGHPPPCQVSKYQWIDLRGIATHECEHAAPTMSVGEVAAHWGLAGGHDYMIDFKIRDERQGERGETAAKEVGSGFSPHWLFSFFQTLLASRGCGILLLALVACAATSLLFVFWRPVPKGAMMNLVPAINWGFGVSLSILLPFAVMFVTWIFFMSAVKRSEFVTTQNLMALYTDDRRPMHRHVIDSRPSTLQLMVRRIYDEIIRNERTMRETE
jgi:hypothetical protein